MPLALRMECPHVIRDGVLSSLMRWPVAVHYLAGTAVVITVNLKEDDAAVFGDAELVFDDDPFEYERVENGAEVGCKETVDVGSYGPADILLRDGADLYWRWILGNPVFGLCGDESTLVV